MSFRPTSAVTTYPAASLWPDDASRGVLGVAVGKAGAAFCVLASNAPDSQTRGRR